MANRKKTKGLHNAADASTSSRSAGAASPPAAKSPVPQDMRKEVTRPIGAGVAHRGDRRDMSKTYAGNQRHPSRGNNPRPDVKTRKR